MLRTVCIHRIHSSVGYQKNQVSIRLNFFLIVCVCVRVNSSSNQDKFIRTKILSFSFPAMFEFTVKVVHSVYKLFLPSVSAFSIGITQSRRIGKIERKASFCIEHSSFIPERAYNAGCSIVLQQLLFRLIVSVTT